MFDFVLSGIRRKPPYSRRVFAQTCYKPATNSLRRNYRPLTARAILKIWLARAITAPPQLENERSITMLDKVYNSFVEFGSRCWILARCEKMSPSVACPSEEKFLHRSEKRFFPGATRPSEEKFLPRSEKRFSRGATRPVRETFFSPGRKTLKSNSLKKKTNLMFFARGEKLFFSGC